MPRGLSRQSSKRLSAGGKSRTTSALTCADETTRKDVTPMKLFSDFWQNDDGAVTVDFVVITAAIVIIGLLAGNAIATGAVDLAESEGTSLSDRGLGPGEIQP